VQSQLLSEKVRSREQGLNPASQNPDPKLLRRCAHTHTQRASLLAPPFHVQQPHTSSFKNNRLLSRGTHYCSSRYSICSSRTQLTSGASPSPYRPSQETPIPTPINPKAIVQTACDGVLPVSPNMLLSFAECAINRPQTESRNRQAVCAAALTTAPPDIPSAAAAHTAPPAPQPPALLPPQRPRSSASAWQHTRWHHPVSNEEERSQFTHHVRAV
jgi:hypothetical protein